MAQLPTSFIMIWLLIISITDSTDIPDTNTTDNSVTPPPVPNTDIHETFTSHSHNNDEDVTVTTDTTATLLIRTMIDDLPPELIHKIESNEKDNATTTAPTSPTSTEIEIQTMIAELPLELIRKIESNEKDNATTTASTPPTSTDVEIQTRIMIAEIPPEIIQKINGNKTDIRRTTNVAPPAPSSGVLIPTMIEEHPPEVSFAEGPPPMSSDNMIQQHMLSVFEHDFIKDLPFNEQVIRIEDAICGNTCGGTFPSKHYPSSILKNCQPCFCDLACVTLHDCCPEIILRNMTSYDDGFGSECVQTIPTGVNFSDIGNTDLISMVTRCPVRGVDEKDEKDENDKKQTDKTTTSSFSIYDITSKCEQPDPLDVQQALPVTAIKTGIEYRNRFCAQCNNVNITDEQTVKRWSAEIKCKRGMQTLIEDRPNNRELYRRLNSKEEVNNTGCFMRYFSTEAGPLRKCRFPQQPIIQQCNVTGAWRLYDERLERACGLHRSLVFGKYKNMFCYLCNLGFSMNINSLHQAIKIGDSSMNPMRVSFAALLDFDEMNAVPKQQETRGLMCPSEQIYDTVTHECRDILCSEGKTLSTRDSQQCTSLTRSNTIGYRTCLQLHLVFNESMIVEPDVLLYDLNKGLQMRCCFQGQPLLMRTSVKSWCPGNLSISLNVELFDSTSRFAHLTLKELDERAMGFTSFPMVDSLPSSIKDGLKSYSLSLDAACPNDSVDVTKPCSDNSTTAVNVHESYAPLIMSWTKIAQKTYFIPFRITNVCPHVDLPSTDFVIVNDSFVHKNTSFRINSEKIDYIDGSRVRMCIEDYKMLMASSSDRNGGTSGSDTDSFNTWTASGVVSTVCTCFSLICLILTFVTYLIFSSLRDGSGKNIMALTFLLFAAQTLFEFAIEQSENKIACVIFGIMIHYFWLAAIFSMNACTIERFYKLCFPLKSRAFFFSNKPFAFASAYSLTCPCLIVSLNVLTNWLIKKEVGYGNSRLCYINGLYSRVFSFALPMACVLLTNIILFLCTILSLKRNSTPTIKKSTSKIGITACVRLSCVTGIVWLLAFLQEFIKLEALGYVFTAFLGLQGVFFFYSIVLNHKVIMLYKGLLRSKQKRGKGSGNNSSSSGKTSGKNGTNVKSCYDNKKGPYIINGTGHVSHGNDINRNNNMSHSTVTTTTSLDSSVGV